MFLMQGIPALQDIALWFVHFAGMLYVDSGLNNILVCFSLCFSKPIHLFNLFYFIYFWLHQVFVAVHGFSLVAASRGYSSLWCAGFSLWWLLLLWSTGSRHAGLSSCGSRALERRLSNCGTWAQLLRGMWDLPGPGLEPMSPALAGGFLTTVPPGKP